MIPGSLDPGEPMAIGAVLGRFLSPARLLALVRRHLWLWIAYQSIKGIVTSTLFWGPLLYMYLSR